MSGGMLPRRLAAAVLAAVSFLLASGSPAWAAPLRNADGSCMMFPPGSPWRQDVSSWPVYSRSSNVIATIGTSTRFHADFGGGEERGGGKIYYGIPINGVDSNAAKGGWAQFPSRGAMTFNMYGDESDPGPYPFPINAKIEGAWLGCSPSACSGDRHVLVRDNNTCMLYEGYACRAPTSMTGRWTCGSGAIFNLSSGKLVQRPLGWTSADAAGLPIWPGLVTTGEVFGGAINHAIRFTAPTVRSAYQYPASHLVNVGGSSDAGWMGMRARLKRTFSCLTLKTPSARVICAALKKHGLILADVGSSWYLTGEASPLWESRLGANYDQFLTDIKTIRGSDMEVVVPPTGACLCDRAHADNCGTTLCLI
jgi:hypothetical protein